MKQTFILLAILVANACVAPRPAASAAANTSDLTTEAIADSLLVELTALDPTIVVDMRYATANNFTGAKLPGYEANRAFLRLEAAFALAGVQRALAARGLGLKVFDAYRPVRATEEMVKWTERVKRPDLIADGYIASRSRHNLGVAIDLTLIDLTTSTELEMGTAYDTFTSAAHSDNATGMAATNRLILKKAMQAGGFAPYSEEWWHFSFPVENPVRFDRVIR